MSSALLLLGLLAGNLDEAPARDTVVLLDLQGELDEESRRVIGELHATELQRFEHLNVLTQADLRRAIDLESERAALDCSEQSCLADIAGAYDARLVLFGTAGRLGPELVIVSLNLFDSKVARSRARESITVPSLKDIPGQLRAVVPRLLGLEETASPEPAATAAEPTSGPSALFWVGVAGVGVGGVGALALGSVATWAELTVDELSGEELQGRRSAGVASLIGASVGALVAVGGGVLLLVEGTE